MYNGVHHPNMFTLVRLHTPCIVLCSACETLDWPGVLMNRSTSIRTSQLLAEPPYCLLLWGAIRNNTLAVLVQLHCIVYSIICRKINTLDIPHIYVHMWTIALMSVYIATPPPSPWYLLFQFLPCIFLFEYNHKCTLYKNDWNIRQFQQNLCSNASV